MPLELQVNGKPRTLDSLNGPCTLDQVVAALDMHAGRVAIEHNEEIVPRSAWSQHPVRNHDKVEVVHFVGGGNCSQD